MTKNKKSNLVAENKKASDMGKTLGLGLFVIAILIAIFPLLRRGFFISDDGEWMVIRLSAFYQSLREGQFPVRFLGRLNNGYGYPVSNFLYPGFLYVGSLFRLLGFTFVESVKTILVLSIVGSSVALYKYLRLAFGAYASYMGASAFTLSPYLLYDLYKRGSVGEVLAFFPAIISFYSIELRYGSLLAFAVGFLIISHNSLAVLFIAAIGMYCLIRKRLGMLINILLGIGLSTFFWLPALIERKFVVFDLAHIANPQNFFVDKLNIQLVGVAFLFALAGIIMRNKFSDARDKFFIALFCFCLFMASSFSSFFWTTELASKFIQFPFRFLSVGIVAGAWIIASAVNSFTHRALGLSLFFILMIFPVVHIFRNIQSVDREEGYYSTNEGTTTVAEEYMPIWVTQKLPERTTERISFVRGRGVFSPKIVTTQQIEGQLVNEGDSVIQINSVYYPGWGVMVDGIHTPIEVSRPYGLMRIPVSNGIHTIVAEFRETALRFVADGISLAFFLVIIAIETSSYVLRKHPKVFPSKVYEV